jgi:single-strand DNA-binding protein
MNKVTLYGRIGSDPETKDVNGTTLTKLSLATSERYKDKQGNKQERTEWHRLTLWGNVADIASKYVKKGDPLLVEGSIKYSSSGDGNDKKYYTDINVTNLFLMPRTDSAPAPQPQQGVTTQKVQETFDAVVDDNSLELPF